MFFSMFLLLIFFSPALTHAQTASSPQFLVTWKTSGSYIPSFYLGKALPTYGSQITASLELVSQGKILDLSNQTIYWYLEDNLVGGGVGVQQVTFPPVGEAPNSIIVVETPEEAASLKVKPDARLAYVTQTTLSVSDAQRVIDALKNRFPNIRYPAKDDICYATTNRQNAVTSMSPDVDLVLVIGSKNSSNSQRLVERALEAGKPAYLIDDETELDFSWFDNKSAVLVTAGASAPEHLVTELVHRLQRDFGGEIETRTLLEEGISFELPKSVRSLAVVN